MWNKKFIIFISPDIYACYPKCKRSLFFYLLFINIISNYLNTFLPMWIFASGLVIRFVQISKVINGNIFYLFVCTEIISSQFYFRVWKKKGIVTGCKNWAIKRMKWRIPTKISLFSYTTKTLAARCLPERCSSCTFLQPLLKSQHRLRTFCIFITSTL